MTATNHDNQRHNLSNDVVNFGDFLKVCHFSRFHCCGYHSIPCGRRSIGPVDEV